MSSQLLSVARVHCTIKVAYNIMVELNKLGFARPLTSESILIVSKNAINGQVLVDVTIICSKILQQVQVSDTSLLFAASFFSPFFNTGANTCRHSSGTIP